MATALAHQTHPHPHMAEGGTSEAIITQPSTVAEAPEATSHIFRFFDLPRELRDEIYEPPALREHFNIPTLMLEGHSRHIQGQKLSASLLLVSRQFRDECTERCLDQQILCLRDWLDFSDTTGVLTVLDELRSWVIAICTAAPRRLDRYLGNCAQWYHDLRAVNMRLYLNYQSDLDDCAPYVLDHLQSTISDIASFKKTARLEIYMTKPARRYGRASWSRKLLARWHRGESQATILLGPALETEGSEWEDFEGVGLDVDWSTSSSSLFGSWPDDEDHDDTQANDTGDDQDDTGEYSDSDFSFHELPGQKAFGSADESDINVGDCIDSDEDAGRVCGDEHSESDPTNKISTLRAFEMIMNGDDTDDDNDDEKYNSSLRFYNDHTSLNGTTNVRPASPTNSDAFQISHDTEALIIGTTAPILIFRPPPQDYTRETRLLRLLCLGLVAVLILILAFGALDMITSPR
jgi:hypothetical protein